MLFNAQHPSPHTQHTLMWLQEQQGCSVLQYLQPGTRELQCPLTTRERKKTDTHTPSQKRRPMQTVLQEQSETGSNTCPGSGTEQSSSSGYELWTKTGFIQQPQTGCTNMQVSYHCNLNFLVNLFLSQRSENNQEVVQKNPGKSRVMYLWLNLCMVNITKRKTSFSVAETYLKIAYFSCQDLPFLFFFFRAVMRLSSCQPSVLVNLQNKEKVEKYHIKILNVWKQHLG